MLKALRKEKKKPAVHISLADIHPQLTGNRSPLTNKSQVLVEYTIILGAIVLILFAMNTMLKRGIQGMVKVVADQIGSQENSDQKFDYESGHLEESYTVTRASLDKTTTEFAGVTTYAYFDTILTGGNSSSNLGFTNTD